METISKLFESTKGDIRIKILRFFLSNMDTSFESKKVAENLKLESDIVRKEINVLLSINFLNKENNRNNKNLSYKINKNFPFILSLYNLLFDFKNFDKKQFVEKFKKIGKIKLFVFAGVFLDQNDSLIDILIVCENLKQKEVDKVLNEIRINFGRDLKYLIMDIDEYKYRYKMFDKVLHEVLNGNRIEFINKIQMF